MAQDKYNPSADEIKAAEGSMGFFEKKASEAREKMLGELLSGKSPEETERINKIIEGCDIRYVLGKTRTDGYDSRIYGAIRGHTIDLLKRGKDFLSGIDGRPPLMVAGESDKLYKTFEDIAKVMTKYMPEIESHLQIIQRQGEHRQALKDILLED